MGLSLKVYLLFNVKDGEDLFIYYYLVFFMFWVKNKCFVVEYFFFLYVGIWFWFWRGWKDVDDDDDGFSCLFESLSVVICFFSLLVIFFEVNYSFFYFLWLLKLVFYWYKLCIWLILFMVFVRF